MFIYLKNLSGDIETLMFSQQEITVSVIRQHISKKGYDCVLFKPDEDSTYESDSKNESLQDDVTVKDGDMLYLFYKRKEFTKEETQTFEDHLEKRMLFFPEFKEALIKNRAIIAGGSVLSIFGNYDINDIDIYVNYSNAKELIKDLYPLGLNPLETHRAPAYDLSFFRKNNIISRIYCKMSTRGMVNERFYFADKNVSIDIMIIPDHILLENVVTNFDLTFCQVWWDGNTIHSYDIEDVRSKSGSLNPDYIESYIAMNNFTIKRILKYKNRGFEIKIDTSSLSGQNIIKKTDKLVDSEYWAVTTIFNYITSLQRHKCLFMLEQPQECTLESLYSYIDKEIVDAHIILFYAEKCVYFSEKYKRIYEDIFMSVIRQVNHEEIIRQETRRKVDNWIQLKDFEHDSYFRNYMRDARNEFKQNNAERLRRLANEHYEH